MSDHYWLRKIQLESVQPYFPRSHGRPRVDDRRVISGIIHVVRNGLRWCDAPDIYGPRKTLYNRFVRWSRKGVFDCIFGGLAGCVEEPDIVMIDATHLKAHRTACSLAKGAAPRRIGRTKGGLNPKLHALCDKQGRLLVLCLSEGQLSDHVGAKLIYPAMPNTKVLLGDKGYDSDEFRDALKARKIKANWSEQRPSARTSVRFPVISAQKGAAGVRPQVDHCARGPIDHNQCIRPDPTQMHHPKG